MNRVKVVTRDGHIWNVAETYLDIVNASYLGPVEIDLLSEGPCCDSAGIDKMLDQIIEKFGFDKDNYCIITANQLSSSRYKEKRISWVELGKAKKLAYQIENQPSTLKKRFAMFIGRSNWQRLGLAAHLWKYHRDLSTITFHFDPKSDFHLSNFGLEELTGRHAEAWQDVYEFVQELPIKTDKVSYPILWTENAFDLDYKDIFVEIVCETFFSGKTFFVTEKTLRPIINRRPFIVQGPKGYLKNLQRLGFKTFDQWWDEGYDNDHSDARYNTLKDHIDNWLAVQSLDTIATWYKEMQPILDHNVQVLKNLNEQKILQTRFHHE